MRRAPAERRRIATLTACVAGLALAACQPAASPGKPTFLSRLSRDPDRVVREVGEARGLPPKRKVAVKLDDDAAFARALTVKMDREVLPMLAGETVGFWMAFNFMEAAEPSAPPGPPKGPTSPERVVDEQLLGFYDQTAEEVHVRVSKLTRSERDEGEVHTEYVIGHEIGHALAHQHFGAVDVAALGDEDERLALLSLLEGDASMSGLAFAAKARQVPLRRAITLLGRDMRNEIVKQSTTDRRFRELSRAPVIEQDRLKFPYSAGLSFVGDLVRAEGPALVSRAFSAPPRTTEHILHPDKYLAGEAAIPVQLPPVPAGHDSSITGRMGEFLTGVALSRCSTREVGRKAAEGWGGDAYRVVIDPGSKALRLLWSTAWDDEASAARFEAAVKGKAGCWSPRSSRGLTISDELAVAREGTKVAVVRGFSKEDGPKLAATLFPTVGQRPPSKPPFGPIVVPPPRPPMPADVQPFRMIEGGVASDLFGISAPQPPGFQIVLDKKPATLKLTRSDDRTFSMVLITTTASEATRENHDRAFREFASTLAKRLEVGLTIIGDGATQLPIGRGDGRRFRVEGHTGGAQVVAVPICRDQGSLMVVSAWSNDTGRRDADWIISQLRPLGAEGWICSELDP